MNQEDQRYLDSLTKEELIRERAINQSLILARLYSLPPNYPLLPQQEKEEYNRENQRLIDKKNHLTSGDLLKPLSPPIKRPQTNKTS